MSAADSQPRIAVVIATCDRFQMLVERSLPSVSAQTRTPDLLVVVDDSPLDARAHNSEIVGALKLPGCQISYLENARTKGASGTWNTALDFLAGNGGNPGDLFVAILDDDDSWSSEYLESCYAAACGRQLDMVASDLRWFESVGEHPLVTEAPTGLFAEQFLVGNPGIQGSNLFVRLSILLAAGGFDEALRSTTDRDLCIRIADLGTGRYGRLPTPLVNHYAEQDRPRLSTRGSRAKIDGLSAFWRKYVGRMNDSQRAAFSQRAATLFNCHLRLQAAEGVSQSDLATRTHPGAVNCDSARSTPVAIPKTPRKQPVRLYVGIISSEPATLKRLLHDLASLPGEGTQELAALVLDNGSPKTEFRCVIQEARNRGLKIAIVDESHQRRDAAKGAFGANLRHRPPGQLGIAPARTILQRYLGELLSNDAGSFGWILDDDMRVNDRVHSFLPWLPEFREQGTDVLIGAYEGSSPNPPLNGLRVHLVDLLHNMYWLQGLPDDAVLPDRTEENAALRAQYPDYYYDLSRKHTGHLEMPHWLEPAVTGETVKEAYSRLLLGTIGILSGKPLTRPIIATVSSNPLVSSVDSVNRGGSTFILNHLALTQTPNMMTRIQGRVARRSDMMWAIVNRYYRRMTIKAVDFPVRHLGRVTATPGFDIGKVQEEIIGSTLYSGLTEFLRAHPHHDLDFSSQEAIDICRLADDHLKRRWQMMELSFHRIAGLREAIRRVARAGELDTFIGYLDRWFSKEHFGHIRAGVEVHNSSEVEEFLTSLRAVSDDFASASVNVNFIHAQLTHGRSDNVRCGP